MSEPMVKARPAGRLSATGLFIAGLGLLLGVVSVGGLLAHLFTSSRTELNLALAAATTALPLLVLIRERSDQLLHPLFVLVVLMVLGVLGQTILVQYAPDVLGGTRLFDDLTVEILSLGLIVLAGAIPCLLLGYLWPRSKRQSWRSIGSLRRLAGRGMGRVSVGKVFWVVLACCVVGLVFMLLFAGRVGSLSTRELLSSRIRFVDLPSGGYTSLGYYRLGMSVTSIGFLLAWYTKVRLELSWRSPVAAVGALAFALVVYQGFYLSSRTHIFVPIVWALLVWVAIRGRSPRVRTALMLFVVGLAAAIALLAIRVAEQRDVNLADPLEIAGSLGPFVTSGKSMSVGKTALIVRGVPEAFPYQYGRSFVAVAYAPIPRSMWPDKPPVRLGSQIGTAIFGFSERVRGGAPPGIIGEFYINFGLAGVAVGSVLWGHAIRTVDAWRAERGDAGGVAALAFALAMTGLVWQLPFAEFTGVLSSWLQDATILAGLLLITRNGVQSNDVQSSES